jgi:uncharacterized repeat protein (TIGR01451 family)
MLTQNSVQAPKRPVALVSLSREHALHALFFQELIFPILSISGITRPIVLPFGAFSPNYTLPLAGIAMRVLLLRIGALGIVIVLGCIAIANAQRGSNDLVVAGETTVTDGEAVRPEASAPRPGENPLRRTAATAVQSYPKKIDPPPRRAAADPFGLQARRNGVLPKSAPAERPAPGPALTSTAAEQEPAPFTADPFAMPANPTRAIKDDGHRVRAPANINTTADLASEGDGTGQPGAKQLEGVQSPQLTIQKLAPKEIQVGRPTAFRVVVRNIGQIPACAVEVRDLVPKGTQLLGTKPQAGRGAQGEVVWSLGTIRPGEESAVEMQLMPNAEGEIGSVASVHFGADASARTVATRPQLAVETTGPQKVLIGEQVVLSITISNPGSGVATGIVLEEHIPPGLSHPAGAELEYPVGELKPGEKRKLDLPLVANRPGAITNHLSVRGDGNLRADHKLDLEVLAPLLDVALEGPKRRYLERQATYTLSVANPGTAPAKQVELIASLPPGLKFVSCNNAGYYEETSRTVRWKLEELPANESGAVELVTMPVEAGQHAIKFRGAAQKGLLVEKEQPVMIEGVAAVLFQVADIEDPIGVGGETVYEVRAVNRGSKAADNVRLTIELPPEMKPLSAEGPSRHRIEGNRVVFDGLARLAPKADTAYRIRVKAVGAGDLRARFLLQTDDMQSPVTKEESTRVFADE